MLFILKWDKMGHCVQARNYTETQYLMESLNAVSSLSLIRSLVPSDHNRYRQKVPQLAALCLPCHSSKTRQHL